VSAHETNTAIDPTRASHALASAPHVGRSVPHESADAHVTGAALYTDDLALRSKGALACWPVCAPHAHAWLDHLDVTPALSIAGVVRVLTAKDVPGTLSAVAQIGYQEVEFAGYFNLAPADIKRIREAAKVSQPVFARYLNTSESTVEKWETGAKKPSGMALKLLMVVQKRGLEVLA
jgi:DNA-binding transcriptional regulator YiaG